MGNNISQCILLLSCGICQGGLAACAGEVLQHVPWRPYCMCHGGLAASAREALLHAKALTLHRECEHLPWSVHFAPP